MTLGGILGSRLIKKGLLPWYRSGGIPSANCVAAWRGIGAVSYAASKVNLVNPGTYDLVDTAHVPTWAAATGWGTGAAKYFDTGYSWANYQQTIIIRFSNAGAGTDYAICGFYDGSFNGLLILPHNSTANRTYINGTIANQLVVAGGAVNSGVIAIAGGGGYYNGISDGSFTGSNRPPANVFLGDANAAGLLPFVGNIQAAAIYSVVLTAPQIAALTTAMAALT